MSHKMVASTRLRAFTVEHVKKIAFSNSKSHLFILTTQFTIHPTSKVLF